MNAPDIIAVGKHIYPKQDLPFNSTDYRIDLPLNDSSMQRKIVATHADIGNPKPAAPHNMKVMKNQRHIGINAKKHVEPIIRFGLKSFHLYFFKPHIITIIVICILKTLPYRQTCTVMF